jgi:hypothetical protein
MRPVLAAIAWVLAASIVIHAAPAAAQVQVIVLHPPASDWSQAVAGHGAVQGGFVRISNNTIPVLWGGTSAYTSLLPSGASSGAVMGVGADSQVGYVGEVPTSRAAMWSGSAQSYVDLHPSTYVWSRARAVWGAAQGGEVFDASRSRAALWSGTAASVTILDPGSGYDGSVVLTMSSQRQGGAAWVNGSQGYFAHAALWSGSANSFVDMNPAGFLGSTIWAIAETPQGGVQVGAAGNLWRDTAASFLNLNPDVQGSTGSGLLGTTGNAHVGLVNFDFAYTRAGLWLGDTPESFVDLHEYLPAGYVSSRAEHIWEHNGDLWIAGSARQDGLEQAVLWVVPAPGTGIGMLLAVSLASRRSRA